MKMDAIKTAMSEKEKSTRGNASQFLLLASFVAGDIRLWLR